MAGRRARVLQQFGRKSSVREIALGFSSEVGAIEAEPLPLFSRLTIHILFGSIVVFMIAANFMMIERNVATNGKIVTSQPAIVVQPLETSIIRSFEVKPGDSVRKGDVLVTLDATFTGADVDSLTAQADALRAQVARLEAENDDLAFEDAPGVSATSLALQKSIYGQRIRQHRAELSSHDQKIASTLAAIQRYQQDTERLQKEVEVRRQIEAMRAELERKQSGSKLNLLQATEARLEAERSLANSVNSAAQANHDLEQARHDREAYLQNWRANIGKDLVAARRDLESAESGLQKASRRNQLVQMRAPADGTVLTIGKYSVGSVIEQTRTLLTMVPSNGALEGEIAIDATDYSHVAVGDPVVIKLAAYDYVQYGHLEGRLTQISEDSFSETEDGRPAGRYYYKAKVEITKVGLHDTPANFRLVPGMPFTADIRVGERSLASYFVNSIIRQGREGLREP